ncbi:MAG: tetratricopeptide repeat protein [Treponema sp.]|nr:tetratricopeptide repeat protein [Treponema sp.]
MPSLDALSNFKSSFNNIAREKENLTAENLPFDDFQLPGTEAPPFDPASHDEPPPEASAGAPSDGAGNDFDFSAFFDSAPGDINPPPIDDILADDHPQSDSADAAFIDSPDNQEKSAEDDAVLDNFLNNLSPLPDEESSDISGGLSADFPAPESPPGPGTADNTGEDTLPDDFSAVDDLLSGLSDEIANTPENASDAGIEESFDDMFKDFDTETAPKDASLDDFAFNENVIDLGGESPDIENKEPESEYKFDDNFSDADFAGTTPDSADELPDDFLGDLPADIPAPDSSSFDSTFEDFNLDNLDIGVPDTPADTPQDLTSGDSGFDTSLDDLNFDIGSPDLGSAESTGDTGLDDITDAPGGDSGSIDLDSGAGSGGAIDFGNDDFSLTGLDEILGKSKIETAAKPAPKKGIFKKKNEQAAAEEEPESDEVEEIQLSQADLDNMLRTLAGYPLNLRVACEELIAERVLIPQQLTKLIRYLKKGASPKETAELAGEILEKKIIIPRSFEKMTGEAFEAEKSSFSYIFIHNFLPVLRLFAFIAAIALSVLYLGYKFIYTPLRAESIYKRGYERIFAGEYQRANELFQEAFNTHRKKKWFYSYAEGFRDERRYLLAEGKYDELLRHYPRDKKGVLDYASLETNYLLNYDKANRILQQQLLDFAPNDYAGLIAAGDNFLLWADSNPSRYSNRYEDARFAYARLLEKYGWTSPVVERMMTYFIRTDNLKEVLPLRDWFDGSKNRRLSAASLAELGGYLLDKQLEEVKGVPNPYVENIQSVRAMLLQAVKENRELPEAHYHLARYYKNLGNVYEERLTIENAIRAFDLAKQESVRRRLYRVDAHYRYSNILVNNREFFPAEEQLVRGIELYEDFVSRNLISSSAQLGQLYAAKGDLEYFVKSGNMRAALRDYKDAERNGWSPPEIQYRMGAAYYQIEDWKNSLEYLFKASADLPLNRRVLHALGNAAYKRGDYFAAQGYYNRLLDVLESQRVRLPVLLPNDRPEYLELGERLMIARNNTGVTYEALANVTGNQDFRSRALSLYAESARAWDSITRSPGTMERMSLVGSPGAPGINLGFLNANNFLHANNAQQSSAGYTPEIFIRIDKDALEPSHWEELAPFGGLSE